MPLGPGQIVAYFDYELFNCNNFSIRYWSWYKSVERPSHPKKPNSIRSTVLPSGYFFFPVNQGKAACIWISQVIYEDLGGYTKEEIVEGHKFRIIQATNMMRNVATLSKEKIEEMMQNGIPFLQFSDKDTELPYTYTDNLEAEIFPEVGKAVEREERKRKRKSERNTKRIKYSEVKVEAPVIEQDYLGESDLELLPAELLDIILNHLDLVSLVRLSSTNRRFRSINQSKRLWRDLFMRNSSPQSSFIVDVSENVKTISIDFKAVLKRNHILLNNFKNCKFRYKKFEGHTQTANNVDFVGTDYVLSGSKDATLLLWNIRTGKYEKKFQVNSGGAVLNSGTILGGGTIVAAMEGGTLCTWDVHTGQPIWVRRFNIVPKGFHFFSNQFFTWGYLPSFDLWSISSGLRQKCFVGHLSKVITVKTFKETVASASEDNTVKVWDENANCLSTFVHESSIKDISLCQGQLLVGEEREAKLYDLRTNSIVNRWKVENAVIEKVSLDDKRIFIGMDQMIRYWDLRDSKIVYDLELTEKITSLKTDSYKIAAGGESGSVSFWDFSA
eukprot:TRINITY_DN3347_c0_g1_i2.p1 TRINITY_DN3347_c0_g1~~TRINITY_DN3347_c0_g1_i2.p1  ORF type:complete len:556 (-),score=115.60 TRINITY_DN3347_c0_g1_i2:17-1684(-)